MTTYTATQQQEPFDWNKALDEAIAEPEKADEADLLSRAASWTTCAVGSLCDKIPRSPLGQPEDDLLWELGGQFYSEIDDRQYPAAKHTLSLIEARSAELLKNL